MDKDRENPFRSEAKNPFGYNIQERLVRCPICKTEFKTDKPHVKCNNCNSNLVTVLGSHFATEIKD